MRLHSFWRSSAAYRARIALHWKGLAFETAATSLASGEHLAPAYKALNPQGFVPALEHDGALLGQSLAIIEYLEELQPSPPLLPAKPIDRAQVRAMSQVIACDTHPLQNLRVQKYLKQQLGQDEAAIREWLRTWITAGLEPLEAMARQHTRDGLHLHGAAVTMADVLLVPQMYSARRFEVDTTRFALLTAIDAHLQTLPAFAAAHPDVQPDKPA